MKLASKAVAMRPARGLWSGIGTGWRAGCGLVLLVLWSLCAPWAGAADALPGADDLAGQAPVVDRAGVLSTEDQVLLRRMLADFEQVHALRAGIVIVPSTQPEDIAAYANRLGDGWRIGSHPGLLMVVAVQDRQARIEVSRALEASLPDVFAHRVLRESMSPAFAQGRYREGFRAGLVRLSLRLSGDPDWAAQAPAHSAPRQGGGEITVAVVVAQAMVLVFGAMIYGFLWIFQGLRRWASPLFGGLVGLLEFAIAGQCLSLGPAVAVGGLIGVLITVAMWRHATRLGGALRRQAPQRAAQARRARSKAGRHGPADRNQAPDDSGFSFSSASSAGSASSSAASDSGSGGSPSSDSSSGDFAGGGASDRW